MKIINIDVYFKDKILHVRFDIFGQKVLCLPRTYYLENLEAFALERVETHKGASSGYVERLKYALFDSSVVELQSNGKNTITVFDVTHCEKKEILLTNPRSRVKREYLHHVATFKIPPDSQYLINFLACISLYFNSYRVDSIGFEESSVFTEKFENDKVTLTPLSTSLLILMQKIQAAGLLEKEVTYDPFMLFHNVLSERYEFQRKTIENFTFLDLLNNTHESNALEKQFSKIKSVYTIDFDVVDERTSLSIIKSAKEILSPMTQKQARDYFMKHDFLFNSQFKEKLVAFFTTPPKKAHDHGDYHKNYTEMQLLRNGQIILRDDGKFSIINMMQNAGYCAHYARGQTNEKIFEAEFIHLGNYIGGVEPNCDFHNEIIFSQQCSPVFMKLDFISYNLIQLFFSAYNNANFIVQCQFSPENSPGENHLKRLPQEIITEIVKQSDARYSIFQPSFFRHAIQHGILSRDERYSKRVF